MKTPTLVCRIDCDLLHIVGRLPPEFICYLLSGIASLGEDLSQFVVDDIDSFYDNGRETFRFCRIDSARFEFAEIDAAFGRRLQVGDVNPERATCPLETS